MLGTHYRDVQHVYCGQTQDLPHVYTDSSTLPNRVTRYSSLQVSSQLAFSQLGCWDDFHQPRWRKDHLL